MVFTLIRDVLKRVRALLDPRPKSLDEWAEAHRDVIRQTLQQIEPWLPKEGVLLDVGANVGLFTQELIRIRPGLEFHLFEPVAVYFARCQERLKSHANVHLWNLALSDTNEQRPIYKAKHNPGANSVVPEIMFDRRENAMVQPDTVVEEEVIECRRFSDFAPEQGLKQVAFIKIDTEGFDYAVLRGLVDFLRETPELPPILVELLAKSYHPFWEAQEQVLRELFALGYSAFDLAELPKVGDALLLPAVIGDSFILHEETVA